MLQTIKARFHRDLLLRAASYYGVALSDLTLVGDFDSFIYEYPSSDGGRILRVSHSSKRNPELVMGELDWLSYLEKGGASVCAPIPSLSGRWLEELDDNHGGTFIVSAFIRAEGDSPKYTHWNTTGCEIYGELLGRIHRLSKDYSPADPRWRRLSWDDPVMLDVEAAIPGDNKLVLERFTELVTVIDALPVDHHGFGLIHQDAHGDNLKIDGSGQIRLYDFFDCTYSWYVNDIAIVLFYAAMWQKDRAAFTRRFMGDFLVGYRRENQLDDSWLQYIPLFLKLREIDLYAVILREYGDNWHEEKWIAGFMQGRKACIEAGAPCIDWDFSSLASGD